MNKNKKIQIQINNKNINGREGDTILEVAKKNKIEEVLTKQKKRSNI